MSNPITADELANIIKLLAAQGPLPMLSHSDWDRIIAALREMEAREAAEPPAMEWHGNEAYIDRPMRVGLIAQWAARGGWWWGAGSEAGEVSTEAEARAAVERAIKGGAA